MKSVLISVAMPCYDAASSLPMALASLVAQTYPEWECILIDDGSHDDPQSIVARIADPRIRCIRLPANQGAGMARQIALDHARGDYLCMLDADDWYYPWKLARQLEVVAALPGISLVSTGVAIVDRAGELAGVRRYGPAGSPPQLQEAWRKMTRPPVSHAPSLIRMDAARRAGYSASLRRGEDADFLLNILWHGAYAVVPEATYAYAEYASLSQQKLLNSYAYRMRMLWSYRYRQPAGVAYALTRAWLTQTTYRLAFGLRMADRLIARRSQAPSPQEIEQFARAKKQVSAIAAAFGMAQNYDSRPG